MKSLAIIGAGTMGAALCCELIEGCPDITLSISDKHPEHLEPFAGISATERTGDILADANAVLIAVKPQSFDALVEELPGALSGKLVISIMAGKTLASIEEKTGSKRVVRAMPNLGVKVGRGMTAWIASKNVTEEERTFVRQIFSAVGEEMEVKKESVIDGFTAIAGAGPAYFFHLCELLSTEAEKMGFSKEEARNMTTETLCASAELLETGEKDAAAWVAAVASKGGVTEAALKVLAEEGGDAAFTAAIEAAATRAREL